LSGALHFQKEGIPVLQSYLEQYKASFQQRLGQNGEIFKWRAIKHFQDNWDINASDFPAMLKAALAETSTFLAAGQFFPRTRIEELSNEDPETVNAGLNLITTAGRKLTIYSRSGIDHPVG
jgi:hypothetical protein